MAEEKPKQKRQRLYRVWLSYSAADSAAGLRELRQEVIADEAVRAIQAVLSRHHGIDVLVATIERVAALDEALRVEAEEIEG